MLIYFINIFRWINICQFVWLYREWIGKEVITKYTTKIASNGTFYTDSNGRRWMKRKRNQRSSWNLTLTEPVASNYYPITSSIAIRDAIHQATVITDRPQGGTSIEDGTLELMVNWWQKNYCYIILLYYSLQNINNTWPVVWLKSTVIKKQSIIIVLSNIVLYDSNIRCNNINILFICFNNIIKILFV